MLGGVIHGSGKVIGGDVALPGIMIGALGTSIVSNGARGIGPLDELVLPMGPTRIRFSRDATPRIGVTVNAYESVTLARRMSRPGMRVDWSRSLRASTFVLQSSAPLSGLGGLRAVGLTNGSVITLSERARNPEVTFSHEQVHLQQGLFFDEIWGRPLEHALRERTPVLRLIPSWLQIGGVTPTLLQAERRAFGWDGPFRSWLESEAVSIEARRR